MKFLLLFILLWIADVKAKPYQTPMMGEVSGTRTLAVLGDMGIVQSHSLFFGDLWRMGHEVTYVAPSDVVLSNYGEAKYDTVVIFSSDIGDLADELTEFMNKGGNIIVATGNDITNSLRDFAESCGVEFDVDESNVIDHFSFSADFDHDKSHTAIISESAVSNSAILKTYATLPATQRKVLFKGLGHAVDEKNVLAVRVLRGNPTSYSANPKQSIDEYPENAGADTLLVSALQGRNNARLSFAGSLDMFSNAAYADEGNANEVFGRDLTAWTFGQAGVLRFRDVVHHKSDGSPPDVILHEKERPNDLPSSLYPDPEITRNSLVYRIKDELVFSMVVEEYMDGAWVPFVAQDMQLEFVMLDPHVRTTMQADPKTGKTVATFTAPDNYGIFKFRVLYRRPGYSIIHVEVPVSVRPYKHNEYDRYLFTAYPYYASSFSAMAAFLVFSIFFLFSSDKK